MVQEFDYIVVGGGSAGSAAAARLSERADVSVLLIEAGPESDSWQVRMPLALEHLLNGETYNWNFASEPETGLGGRVVQQPRGKMMGGSSAINGMVYTRGNPQDYDEWRDVFGCEGWGYADVLPYFKRMETAPEGQGDSSYRGRSGPLRLTRPKAENPLNQAFLQAGRQLGYPMTDDSNGAQHEGLGVMEQSIWKGQRWSTARSYLTADVRRRPNLRIVTKALAERVVFDARRAVGVDYRHGGGRVSARARREVILCAGAIGSAQLLMLSGVGPAQELARHGIALVHDLPGVGQNLQDHPDLSLHFACKEPVSLRRFTRWPTKAWVGIEWFLRKTGIAASNQFEVGGYLRTRAGIRKPNVKLEFFPLAISHKDFKPYPREAFQINMTIQDSPVRGEVLLRSADPADKPVLRFNYLMGPGDLQSFKEAIAMTRELVHAPAFDRYRDIELAPGPDASTDADLESWIRDHVTTAFHLSCTCRMGAATDPEAVVGTDLAVHGLSGIRVADASVMPHVVTANTNATAIMIGDRVADFCFGQGLPVEPSAAYWVNPNWQNSQR